MTLRELGRRLAYLFRRDDFARGLRDEMSLHVELRARKLASRGVHPAGAPYAAQRQFGNRAAIQDASSEQWGWTSWERLAQDVRLAGRVLRKSPGFTAFAISTLALGLGVNTAVFTMVDHVMLRGLPYPDSQRLVSLWEEQTAETQISHASGGVFRQAPGVRRTTVSVANLADYRRQTRSFEGIAGFALAAMNLTGIGNPERISGERVTYDYLPLLRVSPVIGRTFTPGTIAKARSWS